MRGAIGVGMSAPGFALGGAGRVPCGRPVVLAFEDDWREDDESTADIAKIRAELRGLGANLVVLSRSGVLTFGPDDAFERHAEDAAPIAHLYGVDALPALFVVDADGIVRFAHRPREHAGWDTLAGALEAAGRALVSRKKPTLTRRELVVASLVAGLVLAFVDGCAPKRGAVRTTSAVPPPLPAPRQAMDITLEVNGAPHTLHVDPRVTLLDALRERLGLTGTKKGCDMGQCGACTVHVDGRRVNACLMLAVMAQGKRITTIEGLARGDELHPVQAAFIAEDGFQCGYCTPGQIMSAVALLSEGRARSDGEIREQMSGNVCRCGAYPNIVQAIKRARGSS